MKRKERPPMHKAAFAAILCAGVTVLTGAGVLGMYFAAGYHPLLLNSSRILREENKGEDA